MKYLKKYFLGEKILIPIKYQDKKPLVREWQKLQVTSEEMLIAWQEKYKNINYGLLLGERNNIVGIDIDGAEGYKEFCEVINIKKINTLVYKTPNNGYRLLFIYDKRLNFTKKTLYSGNGHVEVTIMSNNTYTLMPPSKLEGDKKYNWIKGKAPKDTKIAQMPEEIFKWLASVETLTEYGIIINSKGKVKFFNVNIFVKKILEKHKIMMLKKGIFYIYEHGKYNEISDNELIRLCKKYFVKFKPYDWKIQYEDQILKTLATEVNFLELEGNENYINFKNGLLDLKSFELVNHSADKVVFNQIPHNYEKNKGCPKFTEFLNEVMENDKDRVQLSFEMIGYCLTDSTAAQKAFILYGHGGNGKSVLIKVIQETLGTENIKTLTLESLNTEYSKNELINKKANISSENEIKDSLNTECFKSITSGDMITTNVKYGAHIMFKPYCKLILAMNSLPYTKDKSNAFARRLEIIPFRVNFEESKQIARLEEVFYPEIEGIIYKSVEALKVLIKNNYKFTSSKIVEDTTREYIENNNIYHRFINDCIEYDKTSKVFNSDLKEAYKNWCVSREYQKNNLVIDVKLPSELNKVFVIKKWKVENKHSGSKRYIKNIRLKKIVLNLKKKLEDDDDI